MHANIVDNLIVGCLLLSQYSNNQSSKCLNQIAMNGMGFKISTLQISFSYNPYAMDFSVLLLSCLRVMTNTPSMF